MRFWRQTNRSVIGLCALAAFSLMLAIFTSPSGAASKFAAKGCLDCHQKFSNTYLSMKSLHPMVKAGNCEDCHLRHGRVPQMLLKESGNALCISCHSKASIGMDKKNVHTAIKNGKCVSCHNPHGSDAPHLLKAADSAQLCYKCHDKAVFTQKVQHAPLAGQGCSACHSAHGSDQKNLLTKEEPQLCLACHESGKGSFKKAHGGYPVEQAACSGCHLSHSSPVKGLLLGDLHSAFQQGGCDSCHNAASEGKPFGTTSSGGNSVISVTTKRV